MTRGPSHINFGEMKVESYWKMAVIVETDWEIIKIKEWLYCSKNEMTKIIYYTDVINLRLYWFVIIDQRLLQIKLPNIRKILFES